MNAQHANCQFQLLQCTYTDIGVSNKLILIWRPFAYAHGPIVVKRIQSAILVQVAPARCIL